MEVMDKFVKYNENSHGNQALIHLIIRLVFKRLAVNSSQVIERNARDNHNVLLEIDTLAN